MRNARSKLSAHFALEKRYHYTRGELQGFSCNEGPKFLIIWRCAAGGGLETVVSLAWGVLVTPLDFR